MHRDLVLSVELIDPECLPFVGRRPGSRWIGDACSLNCMPTDRETSLLGNDERPGLIGFLRRMVVLRECAAPSRREQESEQRPRDTEPR